MLLFSVQDAIVLPQLHRKAKFLLHFQPFAATIEEIKYMEEWTHGKH